MRLPMRPALTALVPLMALLVALSPATASAASKNTVRTLSPLTLYDGPGTRYGSVGRLPADTPFHLDICTYKQRWCLVLGSAGEELGWARGSYLIGNAAKIEVTRDTDFTRRFLDPLSFRKHWPDRDD